MLPKLAYLMLCSAIQLLALLARGNAAKDLEILVLPGPSGFAAADAAPRWCSAAFINPDSAVFTTGCRG